MKIEIQLKYFEKTCKNEPSGVHTWVVYLGVKTPMYYFNICIKIKEIF